MSNKPVFVTDQFALPAGAESVSALSPLAHLKGRQVPADPSAVGMASSSTVSLEESPVTGLILLRASAAMDELGNALSDCKSLSLPGQLGSDSSPDCSIRWMSPDEWLLSCPLDEAYAIESQLRERVSGPIAIVNVSGGYGVLTLAGPDARSVLKKSTFYDVDEEHFPVGKVVNTLMAKAQVTLRNQGDNSFEIIVRRSYADYLWLWLQRAGREYGMRAQAAL